MLATEIKLNSVICGKSEEKLKAISDNFFDGVVTDPPYELNFMAKKWDASGIAYSIELWKEVLRVLKPGAYLLCFGGTRTHHRVTCAIEDAGFIIKDEISWCYGEGFPKSTDISKQLDKENNRTKEDIVELGKHLKLQREKLLITRDNLAEKILHNYKNIKSAIAQIFNWELGKGIPVDRDWKILKRVLQLNNRYDEIIARIEAERKIIGQQTNIANKNNSNTGCYNWNTEGTKRVDSIDITAPATELAKLWDGYGTGLKPAQEPIIVAMKPLENGLNYAQNAKKWGVAGLNIDAGRIGIGGDYTVHDAGCSGSKTLEWNSREKKESGKEYRTTQGRWPANLILSHSPDCVCIGTKIINEGIEGGKYSGREYEVKGFVKNCKANAPHIRGQETIEVWACVPGCPIRILDTQSGQLNFDLGGASRFFYCPKAKASEKEAGLKGFTECVKCGKFDSKMHTVIIKGEKKKEKCTRNNHPTVKPLDLMKYLLGLIKMPSAKALVNKSRQVILDPFCGSGTTLVAAEQMGINYIGIDMDSDNCLTSIGRIGV